MKLQKTICTLFLFVIIGCSPAIPAVTFTPEATLTPAATQTATPTPLPTATSLPTATLSPEELITEMANEVMTENKLPADFSELPREQGIAIIRKVNQLKVEKGGEEVLVYISQNKETKEIEYYDEVTGQFIAIPGSDRLLNEDGAFKRTSIHGSQELATAVADGSFQMPTGDSAAKIESVMRATLSNTTYEAVLFPGALLPGETKVEPGNGSFGWKDFFNFLTFKTDSNGKPAMGIIIRVTESNPIYLFIGGSDKSSRARAGTLAEVDRPKDGIVRYGLYWIAKTEWKNGYKDKLNPFFDEIRNDLPQKDVKGALTGQDNSFGPATIDILYIAESIIVYQPN